MSTLKLSDKLTFAILLIFFVFGIVGCSGAVSPQEKEPVVLGEQTETALNLVMTNGTEEEISILAVVPAGTSDEQEFSATGGTKLANEESVTIYQEPLEDGGAFEIVLVIGDATYVLHDIRFEMLDEATIRVNDGVAYIEVERDGDVLSTMHEEADLKQAAETAAQSDTEAENGTGTAGSGGYVQNADACRGAVALR